MIRFLRFRWSWMLFFLFFAVFSFGAIRGLRAEEEREGKGQNPTKDLEDVTKRNLPSSKLKVQVKKGSDVLEKIVDEALRESPSLREIKARIESEKAKVDQAAAYPDPLISVGLMNMPFRPLKFNATPMTGLQVTATQSVPWPKKLSMARKVQRRRVRVVENDLEEARLELKSLVRNAALALAYIEAEEKITKQHRKLIENVIKIVDESYRADKALLQDLLKAKLSLSSMDDRLEVIRRQRDGVEARLNSLIGREIDAEVPKIKLASFPPIKYSTKALIDMAIESRPLLAKIRNRIDVQKLRKEEAKTGYLPDLGLSVSYRFRRNSGGDPVDGMDFWSVGIAIRIPLWSIKKTRARVKEAEANIEMEQQGLRSTMLEIARDVRTARDSIRRMEKRIEIYEKNILPQSREVLRASINAYVAGKVSFITLLDHERTLLKHEINYWRIRVSKAQHWETLQAVVGKEFSAESKDIVDSGNEAGGGNEFGRSGGRQEEEKR